MEPAKPDKINLINRDRQEGNSFAANYANFAKQPGRGEAVRTETPAVCCPASPFCKSSQAAAADQTKERLEREKRERSETVSRLSRPFASFAFQTPSPPTFPSFIALTAQSIGADTLSFLIT
jgi:hypothetical protein